MIQVYIEHVPKTKKDPGSRVCRIQDPGSRRILDPVLAFCRRIQILDHFHTVFAGSWGSWILFRRIAAGSWGSWIFLRENSLAQGSWILLRENSLAQVSLRPLGYFYNWGGGGYFEPPPLISENTGPILKIQAAFESPGKTVEGKQILLTSGSRVTSQVRSKSKCSTFRAW